MTPINMTPAEQAEMEAALNLQQRLRLRIVELLLDGDAISTRTLIKAYEILAEQEES